MVNVRTAVYARLDALTELLGPAWYEARNAGYGIAASGVLGPLRRLRTR